MLRIAGGEAVTVRTGEISWFWRPPYQASSASRPMPSSRWVVTITGCSFSVTVQAPNAPCRQTKPNSSAGSHGAYSGRVPFDLRH